MSNNDLIRRGDVLNIAIKIVASVVAGVALALAVFGATSCRDEHVDEPVNGFKYTIEWRVANWVYSADTNECVFGNRWVRFRVDDDVYYVGWENVVVIEHLEVDY